MVIKNEVCKLLLKNNMVSEYEFIDLSYAMSRLNEIKKGTLHKQRSDKLCPCIKTNIQNYGVVVYE